METGFPLRKPLLLLAAGMLLFLSTSTGQAAMTGNTIQVKVGSNLPRTWKEVQADKFKYGPRQKYHPATKETEIWLPYGNTEGVYYAVSGVLTDPSRGQVAKFHSADADTSAELTFKFHFDKPIQAFRFANNRTELSLGKNVSGGLEYSLNGRRWFPIGEVAGPKTKTFEPLVKDFRATGLFTQDLYLRCYTRNPREPEKRFGPGRWMQLWLAGDPGWGDAATTFFERQWRLWVTAADKGSAQANKGTTPRDDGSPFGIAFGANTATDRVVQMLPAAGVRWARTFPEWAALQPRPNEWNWKPADDLLNRAEKNGIRVSGIFCYFAPWASSYQGDKKDYGAQTRTFPVKKMDYWRTYVRTVVDRYHQNIRYWEVWNEPNSPGFNRKGTPRDYADLVREAYVTARKVDPKCRIGIGVADFDVNYLDQVIAQGAADHFDFVAVHPYSVLGHLMHGREMTYLGLVQTLRKMLARHHQRADLPLWITEIGLQSTNDPKREQRQADAVVKAYTMGLAQGFTRIFWFEARGPSYGDGDHGLIRDDYTPRPGYTAYQVMTRLLGANPRYLGWLNLEGHSYGFVFQGKTGPVLVAWSALARDVPVQFAAAVRTVDLAGKETAVAAGQKLVLTTRPVFIQNLPGPLVAQAKSQAAQRFPWSKDWSKAPFVSCRLGTTDVNAGLVHLKDGSVAGKVDGVAVRRTDKANKHAYLYFDVENSYAAYGDQALEITVVARRTDPSKNGGMNLFYESTRGYRHSEEWWTIPVGKGWQEHTFRLKDANFADNWGWNFAVNVVSSPSDVWVKEVRVKRSSKK